ncbi:hypothetical protein HAX54_004616 [Datura stramonium]|uniref:Uncharacterized protein n=1 Tax=Datura stramonium TaxID=4076 RepID=A0ABS8T815_DATST|nr:hypothetical protein [Datura stramonium]
MKVLQKTYLLSKPVGSANYFQPLITTKDQGKMDGVSPECLFNDEIHANVRPSVLTLEGLQMSLAEKTKMESDQVKQEKEACSHEASQLHKDVLALIKTTKSTILEYAKMKIKEMKAALKAKTNEAQTGLRDDEVRLQSLKEKYVLENIQATWSKKLRTLEKLVPSASPVLKLGLLVLKACQRSELGSPRDSSPADDRFIDFRNLGSDNSTFFKPTL